MKNYFELLGIPVSLRPDKGILRQRYLQLSREHHPDYFVKEGAQSQENALEMSALLNQALKTLNSEEATIAYVLEQKGLLVKDEKYALSPDFLMEMMEFNEAIADASTGEEKSALQEKLDKLEQEIYEPVRPIVADYQEGVTSEEELLQVKDYYFQKKYLERLRDQLSGMA